MRRPAPEVLWTVVLVVVLAAAGTGVAMVALNRPGGSAAPSGPASTPTAPSPSDVTPLEPSPPPTSGPSSPDQPEATASACPDLSRQVGLRVLTLNTHGAQAPDGYDLDQVARFVRRADVDVALLQEVDRFRGRSHFSDMPRVLAARTGMEVAYGQNVDLRGRAVSGTATLSRFPIVAERNVRLPTAPGRKPRGLLRTDLDVHGVRVSVFNTHLEDRIMTLKLRQVAAMRAPVVLGGDLNAVTTSPMMAGVRRFLADAWLTAGFGPGHTWPARAPRLRIDYLYHSRTVRVGSIHVMSGRVSDHRALRARFVLRVAGNGVCVPELDGPVGDDRAGGGGAGRAR